MWMLKWGVCVFFLLFWKSIVCAHEFVDLEKLWIVEWRIFAFEILNNGAFVKWKECFPIFCWIFVWFFVVYFRCLMRQPRLLPSVWIFFSNECVDDLRKEICVWSLMHNFTSILIGAFLSSPRFAYMNLCSF